MKKKPDNRASLLALTFVFCMAISASSGHASCDYIVTNSWGTGFAAKVQITNNSLFSVSGWQVTWSYDNNSITAAWNTNLSGSYSASNKAWNGNLAAGQTVGFGFTGATNGGTIETPQVLGDLCDNSSSPVSSDAAASTSSMAANTPLQDNIAAHAMASTSYVSAWESLSAVNDNKSPSNSNDKSNGAYGNWQNPNAIQWVQYEWPKIYTLTSTEVYWFDDNGGVRAPTTAYIEYWNGTTWIQAGEISKNKDAFNTLTLNAITTNRLRISMLHTEESTGILEWRVFGSESNNTASSASSRSSDAANAASSSSSDPVTGACNMGTTHTEWASNCPAQPACLNGSWQAPKDGGETNAPLRLESDHFAFYWPDGTNITAAEAQNAANTLESIWDKYFGAPLNMPEPYCSSSSKWKAAVHFDNEFPLWGGGWDRNGIHYMGMWVGPNTASDSWGLAHEFMHGVQANTAGFQDCGGIACWIYESHANWAPHQVFRDNVHCSEMLVNAPHLYYGNTRDRYCNWQFFEFLKDKHCPVVVNDMWTSQAPIGQRDPWQKLMLNQGWDIQTLNDMFGEWAMHNVTWDYRDPNGDDQGIIYRRNYGLLNADPGTYTQRRLRLTQLESMDDNWAEQRRFASPYYWAPQRWGYNVTRLYPEAGSSQVRVKFRGVVQPSAHSGWRWGLVATNSNMTAPRYSELMRGSDGEINFCISAGEELYLVVLAAPSVYQKITWDNPGDGRAYPSIYRYPYMIETHGAWPAGFENGQRSACPSGTARHSNGGGCTISNTPPSVYVGPYASVLGGQVSGDARIEDHATVINGRVNGGSVGAMSLIGVNSNPHHGAASFNVTDNALVQSTFYPLGWFGNNLSASGAVRLLGDLELYSSKSSNSFYGLVDNNWDGDAYLEEVTIEPPYQWWD